MLDTVHVGYAPGIHADSRGRRSIDEFLTVFAWHDDSRLDQLRRALEGRA